MLKTEYQIRKSLQLRNVNDDFTFSEQMQKASVNQYWKNKVTLWKLLQASCDEAAQKCYQKINSLTSDIADIDMCNVHSLLSMAKSINADDLVSDIEEDYDDLDIEQLINLFSVKKQILLLGNFILDDISNDKVSGALILRGSNIQQQNYPVDVLLSIKQNIKHFYHLFKTNFIIPETAKIQDLLKQNLQSLDLDKLRKTKQQQQDISQDDPFEDILYKKLKKLTLADILNNIYEQKSFDVIKLCTKQNITIEQQTEEASQIHINYFYLFVNIIKQNYYNSDQNYIFQTSYIDSQTDEEISLAKLVYNIIGTYQNNNQIYSQNVIVYHFFNTILLKIRNQELADLYEYKFSDSLSGYLFSMKQSIVDDMTQEEFKYKLSKYIPDEENIEKFITLNNIIKYKRCIITFVKFAYFFNQLQYTKSQKKIQVYQFDIRKINYPRHFAPNEFIDYLYGVNGRTYLLARKYTDICFQIQNIREQIKQLIQQYSFIGTRQIATDVLYQFFVKNYSRNKTAGYTIQNKNLDQFDKLLIASGVINTNNVTFIPLSSTCSGSIPPLSSVERDYSQLLYGTQSLGDDSFSINVIEYYDDTNYFNIQSETPSTLVQSKIVDYVSGVEYSLDENSLIVSSIVENPVYQNFYSPCSIFMPPSNNKFWNQTILTLNSELQNVVSNDQKYLDLYKSFDVNLTQSSIDVYKQKYINESLKPLFNQIWDTFALSSISDDQLNTDEGILYKEYIGNGLGKNNLLNNANKTFPTIAAFQNINGLIEIDQADKENILFIAKNYYQNVFDEVKKATLKIFKMYNQDSVPIDGWRRQYAAFHGYATSYQQSDNRLLFSLKESKLYKNNGPFVYAKLQQALYQKYKSNNIDINQFLSDYIKASSYPIISGFYDLYLNGELSGFIFNQDGVSSYKIINYQEDKFDNCFTLFKKPGEQTGILTFRSFKMPLSIKIMNKEKLNNSADEIIDSVIFIHKNYSLNLYDLVQYIKEGKTQNSKYVDIFKQIFNNCIQFGILNNTFWIFGKYNNKYKLISFIYDDLKNGVLHVDPYSIHDYVYGNDIELYNINDYVGTYYQNHTINFILFDQDSCLKELGQVQEQYKLKYLTQYNLQLQKITLNIETNTISKKYIYTNALTKQNKQYPLIPMLLQHQFNLKLNISGSISETKQINCQINNLQISGYVCGVVNESNSKSTIKNIQLKTDTLNGDDTNTHINSFHYNYLNSNEISGLLNVSIKTKNERIWKLDKNNETCYISYKSLNKFIQDGTFDYYFNFNPNIIGVQSVNASWDQIKSYVDVGENAKSHIMTFNLQSNKNVLISILSQNIDWNDAATNQTLQKVSYKLNDLTQCQLLNNKIKSNFTAFNLGYDYSDQFSMLLTKLIILKAQEYRQSAGNNSKYILSFKNMRSILKSKEVSKYAKLYPLFKNKSIQYTYYDLIYSYDKAIDVYQVVRQKQTYEIKRQQSSYTGKYSSIFEATNEFFKKIPALGNCCIQPLNVKLVFKNDTGWTFLNDGVIDLDMGCYINDKTQKNKIVGYWQGYKNTKYIKWMGDVVNGGFEQVNIDIEKYILNHPVSQNKINKNLIQICFNACWNQNTQITPDNVYIIVSWNHMVQKYPITLLGISQRNCDVKSFSIFIDKVSKELVMDQNILYPVLKFDLNNNSQGLLCQLGNINLNKNQLVNLDETQWFKYSKNLYYKKTNDKIMYLFTNFQMYHKVSQVMQQVFKSILKQNIYILEQGKQISYDEIKAFDGFTKNSILNQNIEFNFISYLNPKYFKMCQDNLNQKIKRILHDDLLKIFESDTVIEKLDIFELSQPAFERIYYDVKRIRFKVNAYSDKCQSLTDEQKKDFNNIKAQLELLKQKIESIQFDHQPVELTIIKQQINEILKKC